MLGLWHFRNASGRVLTLLVAGLLFSWAGEWIIGWGLQHDPATRIEIPGDPPEDFAHDVNEVVLKAQVQKVGPDGRTEFLLGPVAAAFAFGGVVLMVGGFGAVLLWRRAADQDER